MVTIRTRCSTCGDVDVRPGDIELFVRGDDPVGSSYAFRCPVCGSRRRYPASTRVLGVLLSAGVRAGGRWLEPLPPAALHAPAFRPDDLLDFHLLLERADWFDRLLAVDTTAADLATR